MGYYSDLRIALTKKDYMGMLEKDKENKCDFILDEDKAYVKHYSENNVECVLLQQFSIKYYKEFESVQMLEKYLGETKNGYVFMRIGDRWDDIEYRNTAKYKELEVPFGFIKTIQDKTKKQILNNKKEYEKTFNEYLFTKKSDILEFYESNKEMYNSIKEKYDNNSQFKLFLEVDTSKDNALSVLYVRTPEEDKYQVYKTEELDTSSALFFLGYPNEEEFLNELNANNEEEEEFE